MTRILYHTNWKFSNINYQQNKTYKYEYWNISFTSMRAYNKSYETKNADTYKYRIREQKRNIMMNVIVACLMLCRG